MKILVTGAAGFLGFSLAQALAARSGVTVICADNDVRGTRDAAYEALLAAPNVQGFDLDLNDPQAVAELPGDIDVIYHMAALNGTQNFYERPFEVIRCCTLPTLNLLARYAPGGGLQRFVYAGTSEAYAATVTRFDWPVPTDETVPIGIDDVFNPRWSYAMGKMHGEVATITGCGQYDVPYTIIRYHNAYGPRMGDKHVVPDFYARARGGLLALYGHADTRSFIYVDDAIRATLLVGEAENTPGEIINIGSAREITIRALGEKMKEAAGLEGEIVLHPSPAGSVKRRCPDVAKLHRLVGFEEAWTLEAGLRETAKYYLAQEGAA